MVDRTCGGERRGLRCRRPVRRHGRLGPAGLLARDSGSAGVNCVLVLPKRTGTISPVDAGDTDCSLVPGQVIVRQTLVDGKDSAR